MCCKIMLHVYLITLSFQLEADVLIRNKKNLVKMKISLWLHLLNPNHDKGMEINKYLGHLLYF